MCLAPDSSCQFPPGEIKHDYFFQISLSRTKGVSTRRALYVFETALLNGCQPAENIISCWWVKLIKLTSLITINHTLLVCVVFFHVGLLQSRCLGGGSSSRAICNFFSRADKETHVLRRWTGVALICIHSHNYAIVTHEVSCNLYFHALTLFKNLTRCD